MLIKKIKFLNIRNHKNTELEFNDSLNIFYGLNGAGKTTILESIAISSISKSFMPLPDLSLISDGEKFYMVTTEARSDLNTPYKIKIYNTKGSRKQINTSIGDNLYPKEIIGEIPLVVLYPDNKSITFGSPTDRRDFVDKLLSQASRLYMDALIKYRKILKQRNNLLFKIKSDYFNDEEQLNTWTEHLLRTGSELIIRRFMLINDFLPYFKNAYSQVSENTEEVDLIYKPNILSNLYKENELTKIKIFDSLVSKQKE